MFSPFRRSITATTNIPIWKRGIFSDLQSHFFSGGTKHPLLTWIFFEAMSIQCFSISGQVISLHPAYPQVKVSLRGTTTTSCVVTSSRGPADSASLDPTHPKAQQVFLQASSKDKTVAFLSLSANPPTGHPGQRLHRPYNTHLVQPRKIRLLSVDHLSNRSFLLKVILKAHYKYCSSQKETTGKWRGAARRAPPQQAAPSCEPFALRTAPAGSEAGGAPSRCPGAAALLPGTTPRLPAACSGCAGPGADNNPRSARVSPGAIAPSRLPAAAAAAVEHRALPFRPAPGHPVSPAGAGCRHKGRAAPPCASGFPRPGLSRPLREPPGRPRCLRCSSAW